MRHRRQWKPITSSKLNRAAAILLLLAPIGQDVVSFGCMHMGIASPDAITLHSVWWTGLLSGGASMMSVRMFAPALVYLMGFLAVAVFDAPLLMVFAIADAAFTATMATMWAGIHEQS